MSWACSSGAASPLPSGPPAGDIIIASDLSTSGFYRDAKSAELAIRLAIARHPTIGPFKLAYWSLDDAVASQAWPEKGIQNVSQMLDYPWVLGMVGPFQSHVATEEIPIANQGDLVMISPGTTNTCLTQARLGCVPALRPTGRNNFFRLAPIDPVQGRAMARFVAANFGIRRVAVINEWGPAGDAIALAFAKELARTGGTVVLQGTFDPAKPDASTFLTKAHDMGAQAIFAIGANEICAVRAQMKDDALFLGTDGFSTDSTCVTAAGGNSESILGTRPDVDITHSQDPDAMAAVRAFNQAYPQAGIYEYTFAAYDSAEILIAAIEKAVALNGGALPNRREVLDAMQTITYTGLTGTYSFDKNGDALSPLMSIYQVHEGQWEYMQKLDAAAAP